VARVMFRQAVRCNVGRMVETCSHVLEPTEGVTLAIDVWSLWAMRSEAIWNGLILLMQAFVEAASSNSWMWLVVAVVGLTATRKAWLALLRNVGLAFLRGSASGST